MSSNLLKFLNKLSTDKKLLSGFFANQTFKDLYKFAINHSEGGFSEKELQEAMDIMQIYSTNKFKINKLPESDLESVAGGALPGEETALRSIAMLAGPVISLLISGGDLLERYLSTKKRYESENDKARIAELEQKLMQAYKLLEEKLD